MASFSHGRHRIEDAQMPKKYAVNLTQSEIDNIIDGLQMMADALNDDVKSEPLRALCFKIWQTKKEEENR